MLHFTIALANTSYELLNCLNETTLSHTLFFNLKLASDLLFCCFFKLDVINNNNNRFNKNITYYLLVIDKLRSVAIFIFTNRSRSELSSGTDLQQFTVVRTFNISIICSAHSCCVYSIQFSCRCSTTLRKKHMLCVKNIYATVSILLLYYLIFNLVVK